jgi:hypothetical protein
VHDRVVGCSSASLRIVGAVVGVRQVGWNMSSVCTAASKMESYVIAGGLATWDSRSPLNSVPVVSS